MTRILYDLAGANDRRFSPHCWKARMALMHKGLAFETEPCTFLEVRSKVAFADWEKVPALRDGHNNIGDSWAIAEYLDVAYPDEPSLFGSADGKAFARFANEYANTQLNPLIGGAIVYDIYDRIVDADREYFKASREKIFGKSFDDLRRERDSFIARFQAALAPVRNVVKMQDFLTGDSPSYADYAVFGALQWIRCSSDCRMMRPDDPVLAWRDRILALFDGYAGREPAVAA